MVFSMCSSVASRAPQNTDSGSHISNCVCNHIAGTVIAALTYGVLRVIVGVSLDRPPSSYMILFTSAVDMLLFQNPMAADPPSWVNVLPGYFVTRATMDGAFTTVVELRTRLDSLDRIEQAAHIADGKEAALRVVAGVGVVLARHGRYVIRTHRTVEADIHERLHCAVHVRRAVIVPGFDELVRVALHVTEVDEVDLLVEVADGFRNVNAHRGEVTLTERDAVVLAVVDFENAVVVLDAVCDPGNAAD